MCAGKATLLEGAQLSANRFRCCGITDNPGRFDSKSTQVTRTPKRTDGKGEGRKTKKLGRERQAGGNQGREERKLREKENISGGKEGEMLI